MPIAAKFRTACIARLWEGTRFADARARARMLADAELFVRDIDAGADYPEELVVDRVTRYRPEEVEMGSVVHGHALLHDLTAFILRLSRRDPPDAASRGGAVEAKDAAEALGVSARTLARFRESGLVMHHVRHAGGRVRVACFPDALESFRARSAVRVERAGRTVRMGDEDREAMVRRAVAVCGGAGAGDGSGRVRGSARTLSLHALATQLAPAFGCSVRTARTVLEGDRLVAEALRAAGRGAVAASTHGAAWTRSFAARAAGLGFTSADVAGHLEIGEGAAARAALRGRVERVAAALAQVRTAPLPVFHLPGAQESILAPAVVRSGLPVGPARVPEPAIARADRARTRVDATLAVAFRFLSWRAHEALARLSRSPAAHELDALERDLRWAQRLKRALVEHALPAALVPCVQRLGRSWGDVPPPLRMRWTAFAALECAHALDFGGQSSVAIEDLRPAQLAAHAVERAIARGGPEFAPANGDGPEALDDALRRCVSWWHAVDAGDGWQALAARRSPEAVRVLTLRYGLDGTAPRTFEEIARELRTSAPLATAAWYAAMRGR